MFRKMVLLVVFAALALCTAQLPAEDVLLSQLYGSGVHRYFAGDTTNAHSDFTAAISGGSNDPRPYYFRALANLRMGRQYEAQADMRRGAELEAADVHGAFQVSKALERVQGGSRQSLERYRKGARAVAHQRAEQLRRERYTKARELDRARVRRAAAIAPAPLDDTSEPPRMLRGADDVAAPARMPRDDAAIVPRAPGAPDAFGGEAPAAPAAAANPFEDAAPPRAGANPFGNDSAPAAPDAAPATAPAPPAAGDTDPFGAAAAGGADPFGAALPAAAGDAAAVPATPIAPAAGDAAAPPRTAPVTRPAVADPFGDSAPVTPADGSANPDRAPPAAPAAGDADPFGAAAAPADVAPAPERASAPATGASGGGGAASGLFRAFGRVAEGEAQGKARSWGGTLGRYMPFGSRSKTTTIERSAPMPVPPGSPFDNAAPPTGAAPEGADPFGAPTPPPPGAPAAGSDPFGAPPAAGDAGEMKKEVKGDPFGDDPVQPGETKSADNPFEEKR